MYSFLEKNHNNPGRSVANNSSKSTNARGVFQLLDNRKEAGSQKKLNDLNKRPRVLILQRITQEDMAQAVITIKDTATRHGYNKEGLEAIVRHRYTEFSVGNGNTIVLGKGADEHDPYYGRLAYNCVKSSTGIYSIEVFHAHGGQTEFQSAKGY